MTRTKIAYLVYALTAVAALSSPSAFAEEKKDKDTNPCKHHNRMGEDPTLDFNTTCGEYNANFANRMKNLHSAGKKLCETTDTEMNKLVSDYTNLKTQSLTRAFALRKKLNGPADPGQLAAIGKAEEGSQTLVDDSKKSLTLIASKESEFRKLNEKLSKHINEYDEIATKAKYSHHDDKESPNGMCESERNYWAGYMMQLESELKNQSQKAHYYIADLQKKKADHIRVLQTGNDALAGLEKTREALEASEGSPEDGMLTRVGRKIAGVFDNENWQQVTCAEGDTAPACYEYNSKAKSTLDSNGKKLEEYLSDKTQISTPVLTENTARSADNSASNVADSMLDFTRNNEATPSFEERAEQVRLAQSIPYAERTPEQMQLVKDWNLDMMTAANSTGTRTDAVFDKPESAQDARIADLRKTYESQAEDSRKAYAAYEKAKQDGYVGSDGRCTFMAKAKNAIGAGISCNAPLADTPDEIMKQYGVAKARMIANPPIATPNIDAASQPSVPYRGTASSEATTITTQQNKKSDIAPSMQKCMLGIAGDPRNKGLSQTEMKKLYEEHCQI